MGKAKISKRVIGKGLSENGTMLDTLCPVNGEFDMAKIFVEPDYECEFDCQLVVEDIILKTVHIVAQTNQQAVGVFALDNRHAIGEFDRVQLRCVNRTKGQSVRQVTLIMEVY